jgi:hypothetical protein
MRSLLAVGIVAVLCASVPSWAGDERATDHILIVKSTRTLSLLNHSITARF